MSKTLKFMLIFAPLILASCSGKTPEEHLQLAREYIQKNDTEAAIIELKNVLSKDSKNIQARTELSSVYMSLGYGEGAEKEAHRALENGATPNQAAPLLAKALKFLEKNQELVDFTETMDTLDEEASISVLFYTSLAHFRLGQDEKAKATISHIIEVDPTSKYSRLGQAYLSVENKELDDANSIILTILNEEPAFIDALYLKGQIEFARKQYSDAIATFKTYEENVPQDKRVKIVLAQILLKNDNLEEANFYLQKLIKSSPNNPIVNQLLATIHFNKMEYELAKKHADFAIQNNLDTPSNRVIAGVSAYYLQNSEQAYKNLNSIRNQLSKGHSASNVLAASQLELGYMDEAEETLKQLKDSNLVDANLFTTASFLFLKEGEDEKARELLEMSQSVSKGDDINILAREAILKISLDDLSGIEDLEKIVNKSPDATLASAGLANSYMQTKQYDKALELAKKWQNSEKVGMQVAGWNLAGEVYKINRDFPQANTAFERALNLFPNNPASLMYFGVQYLNNDNTEKAIPMFSRILDSSPNYMPALIKYYEANKKAGKSEVGLKRAADSYQNNSTDMVYLLFYANALRDLSQFELATKTLSKHKRGDGSKAPDAYWSMLADSYEKIGNADKSLSTIEEWMYYKPKNVMAFLRKIAFYDRRKAHVQALKATQEALKVSPDEIKFKMLEINYLILSGNLKDAALKIDNIEPELRATSKIRLLQGRLDYANGNYKNAEVNLLSGYVDFPFRVNALMVFDNYISLNEPDNAEEFMQNHLVNSPEDIVAMAKLADHQRRYSPKDAVLTYERMLNVDENNIFALNNIAWLNLQLKNMSAALSYSEKAAKIKPNHPGILDTYGLALLENDRIEEALEILIRAYELDPGSTEIKEHLDRANKATVH